MTEAEIRRDPYSSALADRPTAILTRTLWFSSLLMGAATLCLGLVVVFGWHTDNRMLVQVLPQFVPDLSPSTGRSLLVTGCRLLTTLAAAEGRAKNSLC